ISANTPKLDPWWMGLGVYDPLNHRVLQLPNCGGAVSTVYSLDTANARPSWRIQPTRGDEPFLCDPNVVYDPVRHRALLTGGFALVHGWGSVASGTLVEWNRS